MRKLSIYIILGLISVSVAIAQNDANLLGDVSDGSLAVPGHLIPLLMPLPDEQVEKITPDSSPVLPFSTAKTCGTCHSYNKINKGWHFNAVDPNVPQGRNGQPWIYVDASTGTQIPLSYRNWQGTYKPEQIGLTPLQFTKLFGRQMPGGGPGELPAANTMEMIRENVSGKLEINCLSCHNALPAHDQAEYAIQIAQENFRWAATATCGFASVTGSAKNMPDAYDFIMPPILDDPKVKPPTVFYNKSAFDNTNKVNFDVGGEILNWRCYFCHSNSYQPENAVPKWAADEDVHIAAGMSCVDCHREDLYHNTVRGYETESELTKNSFAATLSCKGCHLGKDDPLKPTAGRLGAPVPKHLGIPVEHFDILSCTACHCGLWPETQTAQVKTSIGHGIGLYGSDKSKDVLPHIITPVFSNKDTIDEKIAPHNLIWPAFWGVMKDSAVAPLAIDVVKPVVAKALTDKKQQYTGSWQNWTDTDVKSILTAFLSESLSGKPVYICGGKIYMLDDKGEVFPAEHQAAKAYMWPVAHDVRPVTRSLGVRSCQDCHSTKAAFSFGNVAVDSPLASKQDTREMVEFQEIDPLFSKLFAMSFVFRPWLKVVALASCAVLAAVLVLYVFKAIICVLNVISKED